MLRLERVDWDGALVALRERQRVDPAARRVLADAASLSALFSTASDFPKAAARVVEAQQLEPLNPLHRLRQALLYFRFGQIELALPLLDELIAILPGQPLPLYLKALAFLRAGDSNKAKNVTSELVENHPGHAPGRFLQSETLLHFKFKGTEKNLTSLARDPRYAPTWADLLAKVALLHPGEGPDLVERQLERLPAGSRERQAIERLLALLATTRPADAEGKGEKVDEVARFEEVLLALPPDSRDEELALMLHQRAERERGPEHEAERLKTLRALHRRLPDRTAIRRCFAAALTRRAVAAAAQHRYRDALTAVESCLRLEPHETIHLQNRAALFTLMRDVDAYHQAWADLDRHHYRLALLGRIDAASARNMAKPHRMFAQQARLTPEDPDARKPRLQLGVFREERRDEQAEGGEPELAVNQERIDADPEQLRQWIHHRRAELVFTHLSLGFAPERCLLQPSDNRAARARAAGLTQAASSLAVLVPEEGARLGELLGKRWSELADRVGTSYAPPDENAETAALARAHLETFGDAALLCLRWTPDGRKPKLAEELLELLRSEAPFFDGAVLWAALEAKGAETPPFPIKLLASVVRGTLDLKNSEERPPLDEEQRQLVVRHLTARLLCNLAIATFKESDPRLRVDRALEVVDRARAAAPGDSGTELLSAKLLLSGEYYDEARATVGRYLKLVGKKQGDEDRGDVEEIERVLDKARKANTPGRQRRTSAAPSTAQQQQAAAAGGEETSSGDRVADLERHIERFPSSIQSYEDLSHLLAGAGRLDEAVAWGERAFERCLSRDGQTRARALHLEAVGLRALAAHGDAVQLWVAGTHGPLLKAIESLPVAEQETRPYAVDYLLGLCRLAARQRDGAQAAFVAALRRCQRQLHLVVLRPLAADVESVLLQRARRSIHEALNAGHFEEATVEARATLAELRAPEAMLVDLGRIQLAAAIASLGADVAPPAVPPLPPSVSKVAWAARFAAASSPPQALERVRRLSQLALDEHPPSAKEAQALLRKLDALEEQLRVARAVADSGRLLREGKWNEALALLDGVGEVAATDPRVLRQRALLLLRLSRFDDAEEAVAQLADATEPVARELLERWPQLRFQHRLASVNKLMRGGDGKAADALLAGMVATTDGERMELAYCRAFSLAQQAYVAHQERQHAAARQRLAAAIDLLQPHLAFARTQRNDRLAELQAKLEKDLTDVEAHP